MSETGVIFDIQRFCIHDGPGIRSTVFLKGCPLSCLWCHNPESKKAKVQLSYSQRLCENCRACEKVCPRKVHDFSDGTHRLDYSKCIACGKCVSVCPASALELIGRRAAVEDVLDVVMKDADYYESSGGGITVSGGEPLLQPDFAIALLKSAKEKNLHTCIETSGFCKPEIIERAAQFVDVFLMDFKLGNSVLHQKYTGVPNAPILANLELLDRLGASVVMRCPIIPGINDNTEHFESIARYSRLSCVKSVEIMAYHTMGVEKAHKIGVDYDLDAPAASYDQSVAWYEEIQSLGCSKIVKP